MSSKSSSPWDKFTAAAKSYEDKYGKGVKRPREGEAPPGQPDSTISLQVESL